jgi:excisionase family DNA binding protein
MKQGQANRRSPLVSLDDAATYLGISRDGIYRLIAAGELSAIKIRRRTLLDPEDIDRLIERSKSAAV